MVDTKKVGERPGFCYQAANPGFALIGFPNSLTAGIPTEKGQTAF